MRQPDSPTTPQLLRWLLRITAPVHGPLLVSLFFRVANLTLDLALFGTVAAGAIKLAVGGQGLTAYFTWIIVLALLKATAYYLEQFTGHYVAFKALELLRTHVFAKLWPKAPSIVTGSRSGDLLASLTRDIDRIEVVYAHTFAPVVAAYIVGATATLAAALTFGPEVATAFGLPLFLSLFVVPYLGLKPSFRSTREALEARRDLSHQISDSVFGLNTVLGYSLEDERLRQMADLGDQVGKTSAVARDWVGIRRGLNVTLSLLAVLSVVLVGVGSLEPWVVAGLAAATLRLFEGPRGVEDSASYLDHSLAAARRLYEVSHAPETVVDGPERLTLQDPPEIVFENVTYTYPNGKNGRENSVGGTSVEPAPDPVLRNVSLRVPAGGHGILVGASGSGKSTLVQLLARYDDPDEGRVEINGCPVQDFDLDSLRANVVIVTQKEQLLDRTVKDNLLLAKPDATTAELWESLKIAGVDGEVAAMPEGLDTQVGVGGDSLSGGQMQRICLARALLLDPKVLILDEFASSLNLDLEEQIRASLRRFRPNLTVLEVTHRLQALDYEDVVAVLDRGDLILSGDPTTVTEEAVSKLLAKKALP